MTTAIVTITCPSCGGKIEGITATNADQTIKCTYCGTELHVPRVGEVIREVVHEVIREVPSQPVFVDAAPVDLTPKKNPWIGLILLGVVGIVAIPVLCTQQRDADKMMDDFAAQDKARDACIATCKAQCQNAGDKDVADSLTPPSELQQTQDLDRKVCTSSCEVKAHCYSLKKPAAN